MRKKSLILFILLSIFSVSFVFAENCVQYIKKGETPNVFNTCVKKENPSAKGGILFDITQKTEKNKGYYFEFHPANKAELLKSGNPRNQVDYYVIYKVEKKTDNITGHYKNEWDWDNKKKFAYATDKGKIVLWAKNSKNQKLDKWKVLTDLNWYDIKNRRMEFERAKDYQFVINSKTKDHDNDGIPNAYDANLHPEKSDKDKDGIIDEADSDADGDGKTDKGKGDKDGDGISDNKDPTPNGSDKTNEKSDEEKATDISNTVVKADAQSPQGEFKVMALSDYCKKKKQDRTGLVRYDPVCDTYWKKDKKLNAGKEFLNTLERVLSWITKTAILLGFGMIVWAGFLYLKSSADPESKKEAKGFFKKIAIGLFFILFAFLIVQLILNFFAKGGVDGPWSGLDKDKQIQKNSK